MFKIYDRRNEFYQWDLNQKLIVEDNTVTQVHFCNRVDDCSLVCEVYDYEGYRVVNVPNLLLQYPLKISVYAYCDNYTKVEQTFRVYERTKPADYIYTETEVKSYEKYIEDVAQNKKDIAAVSTELNNTKASVTELEENTANSIATIDTRVTALENDVVNWAEVQDTPFELVDGVYKLKEECLPFASAEGVSF